MKCIAPKNRLQKIGKGYGRKSLSSILKYYSNMSGGTEDNHVHA
jgi:hypothetical protein